MKSAQVASIIPPEEQSGYSDLQVLQSAAGFYVGTVVERRDHTGRVLWEEPGSRDSCYFASEAEAEAFLSIMTSAASLGLPAEAIPGVRMTP